MNIDEKLKEARAAARSAAESAWSVAGSVVERKKQLQMIKDKL